MRRIYFSDYPELATVWKMYEINGPYPGVHSDSERIHFCTADINAWSPNNPCVIPREGYNYSMKKSLYWNIVDWKQFLELTGCENVQSIGIYPRDKIDWEHIDVQVSAQPKSIADYKQATGLIGVTGDPLPEPVCLLSDFDSETPYPLRLSSLLECQIRISPDAEQGELSFMEFQFTALVE